MRYGAAVMTSDPRGSSSQVQSKRRTPKRKYHVLCSEDGQSGHDTIPPLPNNGRRSIFHVQDGPPHQSHGPSEETRQDKNGGDGDFTIVVSTKKHFIRNINEPSGGFFAEDESTKDTGSEDDCIPQDDESDSEEYVEEEAVLPHRSPGILRGEQPTSSLWDAAGSDVTPSEATRRDKNGEDGDLTVVVSKKNPPTKKIKETSAGCFVEDESSEYTGDDDDYKPQDDENDSEEDEEVEDQSEDDEEQDLKGLGECGNSTTELVLDSFKDWLQGIDGGDREQRTAKQYVSQISAIIS